MSNLALYRKYRPKNFDQVGGQETITRILKNQIAMDRVGHAYLFSGIRGTGKTSIAKIFARAVNCENPVDGSPCEKCQTCQALSSPTNVDIQEIDAASNRGVDEIRNLRDTVKYLPTSGKYKVYIIDEVHMLTKEAFNALLKTLEEPPEHAIFILATTEPSKLPATILSRCQVFAVRPIDFSVITDRLKEVVDCEGIDIEEEALTEISSRSGHSMRDALSILDQCIDLRLPGEIITREDVADFLGISPVSQIEEIMRKIAKKDSEGLIKVLAQIRESGREDNLLLEDLSENYKELLYFKLTGKTNTGREDFFLEMAQLYDNHRLYEIIDTLVEVHAKLKYNQLAQILTDTALLSLTADINQVNEVKTDPKPGLDYQEIPPETYMDFSVPFESVQTPKTIAHENKKEPERREIKKSVKNSSKKKRTSVKAVKEQMIEMALQSHERLLAQLFERSEIKINKHGLFLLIEDEHAFMFKSVNFPEKLQSIVDMAMGEHTKVYPKLKSKYYEHFGKKEEKSLESQVREVVGDDVIYIKEE